MSRDMESIIRPFQNGDVFTARRAAPSPPASGLSSASVEFSWGKGAPTDFIAYTNAGVAGFVDQDYTEKSRNTEIVRVENPTNPNQFVDVERITKVTLANRKGWEISWSLRNTPGQSSGPGHAT